MSYRIEYFPDRARPRPHILHWGFYFPFTVWKGGAYPHCTLVHCAQTKRQALKLIRKDRADARKGDRSKLQVIHEEAL